MTLASRLETRYYQIAESEGQGCRDLVQWSMKLPYVGQGISGINQTTKAAVECNDEGTKTRKHYTRTISSDVASVYSFLPLQHTNDGSSLRFSIRSCGVLVPVREKGGADVLSPRRGEVVKKTGEDDTPKPWP